MKIRFILLLAALFFIFLNCSFAEEITITTYYPSPYGSYRELRSQRMTIGDTYMDASDYCWGAGCGTNVIGANVDLAVEGITVLGRHTPDTTWGAKLYAYDSMWLGDTAPLGQRKYKGYSFQFMDDTLVDFAYRSAGGAGTVIRLRGNPRGVFINHDLFEETDWFSVGRSLGGGSTQEATGADNNGLSVTITASTPANGNNRSGGSIRLIPGLGKSGGSDGVVSVWNNGLQLYSKLVPSADVGKSHGFAPLAWYRMTQDATNPTLVNLAPYGLIYPGYTNNFSIPGNAAISGELRALNFGLGQGVAGVPTQIFLIGQVMTNPPANWYNFMWVLSDVIFNANVKVFGELHANALKVSGDLDIWGQTTMHNIIRLDLGAMAGQRNTNRAICVRKVGNTVFDSKYYIGVCRNNLDIEGKCTCDPLW